MGAVFTGSRVGGNAVFAPAFATAGGTTVPGAPTGVSASAGNAQATVSFSAPADNGGATISSYTVTGAPGGSQSGSASPIVVTGLTNGTAYTFTVRATNSVGIGPASAASGAVTPSAGAPTYYRASRAYAIPAVSRRFSVPAPVA